MEEPKSLDSLCKEKIFRIPDYQRGYAWQREQLKDFWEDLINLSGDSSHPANDWHSQSRLFYYAG